MTWHQCKIFVSVTVAMWVITSWVQHTDKEYLNFLTHGFLWIVATDSQLLWACLTPTDQMIKIIPINIIIIITDTFH